MCLQGNIALPELESLADTHPGGDRHEREGPEGMFMCWIIAWIVSWLRSASRVADPPFGSCRTISIGSLCDTSEP